MATATNCVARFSQVKVENVGEETVFEVPAKHFLMAVLVKNAPVAQTLEVHIEGGDMVAASDLSIARSDAYLQALMGAPGIIAFDIAKNFVIKTNSGVYTGVDAEVIALLVSFT